MENSNELWTLFKQAVLSKDPLQFNIYVLYRAVENAPDFVEIEEDENALTM